MIIKVGTLIEDMVLNIHWLVTAIEYIENGEVMLQIIKLNTPDNDYGDVSFKAVKEAFYNGDAKLYEYKKQPRFRIGDEVKYQDKLVYRVCGIRDKGGVYTYDIENEENSRIDLTEQNLQECS